MNGTGDRITSVSNEEYFTLLLMTLIFHYHVRVGVIRELQFGFYSKRILLIPQDVLVQLGVMGVKSELLAALRDAFEEGSQSSVRYSI